MCGIVEARKRLSVEVNAPIEAAVAAGLVEVSIQLMDDMEE